MDTKKYFDKSITLKNQEYVTGFEEKYNTIFLDAFAWATIKHPNIISNDILEFFVFIEKTKCVEAYYSKIAQDKVDREHGSYFLKKERIIKLLKEYGNIVKEHEEFLKEIKSLDFRFLSDKKLLKFFNRFFIFYIKMLAYYRSSRHEAEIKPSEIIKNILKRNYVNLRIDEVFGLISESSKVNIIEKEKRDWVKLLSSRRKVGDIELKKHIEKYACFYINFWNVDEIIKILKKRIKSDKKRLPQLKKEVQEKRKFLKELPAKQNTIYKKCKNNKDLIVYSNMFQEFGRYRFEIKNIWAGAEILFMPLFEEIAHRLNESVFNIFNYYTIEDIKKSILSKNKLSKEEIKKRKIGIAILVKNRKYNLVTGQKALKLLSIPQSSFKKVKKVTGDIAYKGIVRGRVKQVYPDTMGKTKFNKGDILVTTATQPSMVPIMTKASAFVTDFGGITSHSAIVARELKKPCIIGTKIGSRMFKDGDFIEVNAVEGYVIKLDSNKLRNKKNKKVFKIEQKTDKKIKKLKNFHKNKIIKIHKRVKNAIDNKNILDFNKLSKKDVAIAGGKGASLGEMISVKMPVPSGFVILADAFDIFLTDTKTRKGLGKVYLSVVIKAELDKINYNNINSVDRASNIIRGLIHDSKISDDLRKEILVNFKKLKSKFVAVRSSATAEDSSTASWAGELDSFLDTNEKQLLENVKKCWSSLFTPRAIFYRHEKKLLNIKVSVAVVVQIMVESEISGITFTVHPVTEDRNQMIIEAGWGLGEAIVSGSITPDSYVVDKKDMSILDINISKQEKMITRKDGGGVKTVNVLKSKQERQVLTGKQILKLAKICADIEKHYKKPQDIEWAYTKGKFYIVQSRPITTL